jgi:hypothetical protein
VKMTMTMTIVVMVTAAAVYRLEGLSHQSVNHLSNSFSRFRSLNPISTGRANQTKYGRQSAPM